jgi:hypothetical protein
MNTTWCCACGEKGTAQGIRAASKALTDHLTANGHPSGEYSYGTERLTVVEVVLDDGTPVQRIAGQRPIP